MITNEDIEAVARKLMNAFVGLRWTEDDVRGLVDQLGWEWAGESDGRVRVVTGLPGGDAVFVPVGAAARAWAPLQEYLELAVPVSRPAPEARAQAEEFRRVADAVRRVLGDATYVGAHGFAGPSGWSPEPYWGRPFLHWHQERTALELRAGVAGPELVLQSSEVWESWYAQAGQGFAGVLADRGHPLEQPRWENIGDWEQLQNSLGAFLRTLPAETLATGLTQSIPLYGLLPGEAGPLLFGITCFEDRLYVDYTEYCVPEAARGDNAAALGWTSRNALPPLPARFDGGAPWRVDAGGPGEVASSEIAALIVRTARIAGVESPTGLMIGGEAMYRGQYRLAFPGLAMPTC
ncbi:hypothetical protein GCM10010430_50550 [Kitasatospora cystarginea]|uniref:Uncharacterized protein n=1 Tax=Kitasatospora cystarginea TaxID=58350 RepID=A0ABN3EJN2_9ACTN